jgi:hypothetical protein
VPKEEVKETSNRIARFAMLFVRTRTIAVVAGITYAGTVTKVRHPESTSCLIIKKYSQPSAKGLLGHIFALSRGYIEVLTA